MKNTLLVFITLLFIGAAKAQSVGIGTTTPAASAQLDVSSTTKGLLPPRMTFAQRDAIITPAEGLMIYNTETKKPNYFDGTAWKNFDGTAAVITLLGYYGGGIVAYILQSGDPGYIAGQVHGIIAAASDLGTGTQWGCYGTAIYPGAAGTALGTGNQNTIDIMTGCATPGIAARICGDLVLNGYNDWYLPGVEELNKLIINQAGIGGFSNNFYWTSSEIDPDYAYSEDIFGYFHASAKNDGSLLVRAVRSF